MKRVNIPFLLIFMVVLVTGCHNETVSNRQELKTFCNPLNLSYRFCLEEPSRREAADPTIVWFRDRYYLFASKSGGYWHSVDLAEWKFIETSFIPAEEYAPTAIELDDTLYFLASSTEKSTIYKSGDPLSGVWSVALDRLEIPVWDPAFFLDDDQRLYLYWGCSDSNPIYGVEIDFRNNFAFQGEPKELIHGQPDMLGWEVPGDYNTFTDRKPWIEGAWMNKINGKYYLQYSGPGTEFKSYSDGVYISGHPLGPFELQQHNPFAYKPEGYVAGAGHGSTFEDRYGNLWHIGTITISQKHMFERRLGLFPVFLEEGGTLYSVTRFGDYPLVVPDRKISGFEEIFPGWMLLSYRKKVEVSSAAGDLPAENITDEDIRNYWAAASGEAGESAILDLGDKCSVYALQINFAEHNTNLFGRGKNQHHRYSIDYSDDGSEWKPLIDQSESETDLTHAYFQLAENVDCRYLKITNVEVPDGHFALSGFRVFGFGKGDAPEKAGKLTVNRDPQEPRRVTLNWDNSGNSTGYVISYGSDRERLLLDYMVYGDTTLTINSLNASLPYFFTIDSFNENGVTKSGLIVGDNTNK